MKQDRRFYCAVMQALSILLLLGLSACGGSAMMKDSAAQADSNEAAEITSLEQLCQSSECRKDVHIRLYHGDEVFDATYELMPPTIQDWGITIYPGDEFLIEAELDGNQLVNLRLVPEVLDASRTLKLKFWQNDDDEGMFLKVENPFTKPLRYQLGMSLLDDDDSRLLHTSACAVMPGLSMYEHWGHAIFQLVLVAPHLLEEDDPQGCI